MIKSVSGSLRIYSGSNMNNLNTLDYKVLLLIIANAYIILGVRELMDKHMTYDKEKMLNVKEADAKKKPERFIWSYIIRPVRKGYED